MTKSVAEILHLVETLAHRLMEPVDDEMGVGGWRDESAVRMSETSVELPPRSDWSTNFRPCLSVRGTCHGVRIHLASMAATPMTSCLHSDARFGKPPERAAGNVLVTARLSAFEATRL